jgi:hypothetical protein
MKFLVWWFADAMFTIIEASFGLIDIKEIGCPKVDAQAQQKLVKM